MAFGRRKNQERDPFSHLEGDREEAETGAPWFLDSDGGPDLDIEAGISSNLRHDDLDEGSGAPAGPPVADGGPAVADEHDDQPPR